jgi:uncharacterized membrane protein
MGVLFVIIIVGGIAWGLIAGIKVRNQQDAENNTFAGEHR